METKRSPDEVQAEAFITLLRLAGTQAYSERLNGQLSSTGLRAIRTLPIIVTKLKELKSDPDYAAMISFMGASGLSLINEFQPYFLPLVGEKKQSLEEVLLDTLRSGHEEGYLSALTERIQVAGSLHAQWVAMKDSFFGLNKLGHHHRAQNCSLIAYEIAQLLENKELRQRSTFAILHSSRMLGNSDLRYEYRQENSAVVKGEQSYAEANQCLVPLYAAMHLMDFRDKGKKILRLLNASDEYLLYDFARVSNKVAWARYNCLSGRVIQARNQVHELTEEFDLSVIDVPLISPLLSLANELGVDVTNLGQPSIKPASRKQWLQFDLAIDSLCTKIKESRDRRGKGIE